MNIHFLAATIGILHWRRRALIEKIVTIGSAVGLHARPAALFAQLCKEESSEIRVVLGDKEANGKSIISLLTLGAKQGDTIKIKVSGENEKAFIDKLVDLVERDFDE